MKTRVYLTVDVECREERNINGRLQPLAGYDLRMWGRFSNQSRDLGIGLIMREYDTYGFKATFYVDPFGALFFGMDGLKEVCDEIRNRGHDLQLHAHPIQRVADYITRNVEAPSDKMADYDVDQQTALLREAMGIFEQCGVAREEITSFRAGHFGANNDTWQAMARAGLKLSSNYNLCYQKRECKMRWPEHVAGLFDTACGVWELPISNFTEAPVLPGSGDYRHVQVTAISLSEVKDYLEWAHGAGLGEVTIVTHSFEFFHIDDEKNGKGRLNTMNLYRLRGLAKYLDKNRDRFKVDTAGALARRLPNERPSAALPLPTGKWILKVERLMQQAYKRLEARTPQVSRLAAMLVAP
jgi:hypothetical protein